MAGKGAVPALAGHDGGDAFVLQPAEQAPQLGAQDCALVSPANSSLDGIQHHALGADGIDGVAETDEQASRSYSPVSSISLRSMYT